MASTPKRTVVGDVFNYQWDEEQVSLTFDRFVEDSKENLFAETTVESGAPGMSGHLHQAKLNLTSTTARRTLVNTLREHGSDIDWYGILEQACVATLRRRREGEPAVKVGNNVLPPGGNNRFLLEPLLYDSQPNVLFGPGGVGKTLIALVTCLLVQTGTEELGLLPHEVRNVLFLDYETSREDIEERIGALKTGLSLPPQAELLYRFCSQPVTSDLMELRKIVALNDIGFIVVDSIGTACGGEPESAAATLSYFAALRSLRVPTLSIDHISHGDPNRPFGSVYKWNAARNVMQARAQQEAGEDNIQVGIYQRKNNNGRQFKPMGFNLDFSNPLATRMRRIDVMTSPELSKGTSLKSRMESELKRGAMSRGDLAETLQVSERLIQSAMNGSRKSFVDLPGGRVALPSNPSFLSPPQDV